MPSIYLAGPINHLTYSEATNWRKYAQEYLADYGITGVSPLRSKEFLHNIGRIATANYGQYHPLATDSAIRKRDKNDVRTSDLVLANFLDHGFCECGKGLVSCGTPVEFGWADAFDVPVVMVAGPGNPFDHPIMRDIALAKVPSLDEALEICVSILTP